MAVQPLKAHPLLDGTADVHRCLDSMSTDGWAGLEAPVIRRAMAELARAEARLKAHQVAAARALEASGAARRAGAGSTADLLAGDFGGDRGAGHQLVRTAQSLQHATQTEQALCDGRVSFQQARVIADGLAHLPADVTPDQRKLCEKQLLSDAPRYTLKDLRRRTDRATDAFKPPSEVDAHENDLLLHRERRARQNAEFWMSDLNDGTTKGGFRLPTVQAEMLKAAVEAISAPRRDHLHTTDETFDSPATPAPSRFDHQIDHRHRMGLGLADLCDHLPVDGLPAAGGIGAQLVITLDHDTLKRGVKAATLSTGTRVSAGQTRQLACRLRILPQVLGGASVPLDQGREKRLFTKAQRTALATRDHGCSFPGCDKPPQWTETHHARDPWSGGGTTDLADGVLICPTHHRIVHEQGWQIRFHPDDGIPEYRPPDDTTWRRNHRWRP